jgi:mannosyltransferase
MRRFLTAHWPEVLAGIATLGYGACVFGFGLVFRPMENDESVTLQVASLDSVRGVLDAAVNYRHGPPLHYLLVHASLAVRDDVFGLRLPSALLGMTAVALAYGCGRELLGRAEGAVMSVIVATSPMVVHLGQFARGYTAMLSASFLSLWLLLILLRTRQLRWAVAWGAAVVLLAASHPFGLFALLSELILLAVLGLWPLIRARDGSRRALIVTAVALVLGAAALLALRHVYAPLQDKYNVGQGGAVIDPFDWSLWRTLGETWFGTSVALFWLVPTAVALAGVVLLIRAGRRRPALVIGVWLAQPLITLSLLTAASSDFAPQRHLSFLLPGFAAALAYAVVEAGRRLPRGPIIAVAGAVLLLLPGVVAIARDVGSFTPDLRDASISLSEKFGPDDVLLTTAGKAEPTVPARLYGAYATLEAPDGSALSKWPHLGDAVGCTLVNRLHEQRPEPANTWVLLRTQAPDDTVIALRRAGADLVEAHGEYIVARFADPTRDVAGALRGGARAYRAAASVNQPVGDFDHVLADYRLARALEDADICTS